MYCDNCLQTRLTLQRLKAPDALPDTGNRRPNNATETFKFTVSPLCACLLSSNAVMPKQNQLFQATKHEFRLGVDAFFSETSVAPEENYNFRTPSSATPPTARALKNSRLA